MTIYYKERSYFTGKDLALSVIGGRWKIAIIWSLLQQSPLRLSEIQKKLHDANQRMLIRQLRELEDDKIITRFVYPVVPAIELEKINEIYFRKIEKRFIIDIPLNKKDQESDFEIKLRKMDKIMEQNDIMFEGESGYFIYSDLFFKKGDLSYKSVYSTLCIENIENRKLDIKEIQGGDFICIAYLNKEREIAVNKLRKYIKENNIKPVGIVLEAQLFNTLETWENDNLLYELQILI